MKRVWRLLRGRCFTSFPASLQELSTACSSALFPMEIKLMWSCPVWVHTHVFETESKSVCLSPKQLWSLLDIISQHDSRHYVPLTPRKPMSEWWWEMLPVPPLRERLQRGLSTLIRHQITCTNKCLIPWEKLLRYQRAWLQDTELWGKQTLVLLLLKQLVPRNVIKTAQLSFHLVADNSAWSSHVVLPGWSPSDRWRAWTLRCFGQLGVLLLTWQFWSLRWAGSRRSHLRQTPRWGQAMSHQPHSSVPRKGALQRDRRGGQRFVSEAAEKDRSTIWSVCG